MSSDGWFAVSYNYFEQKHGELWYKINELDDVKAVIVFFLTTSFDFAVICETFSSTSPLQVRV